MKFPWGRPHAKPFTPLALVWLAGLVLFLFLILHVLLLKIVGRFCETPSARRLTQTPYNAWSTSTITITITIGNGDGFEKDQFYPK